MVVQYGPGMQPMVPATADPLVVVVQMEAGQVMPPPPHCPPCGPLAALVTWTLLRPQQLTPRCLFLGDGVSEG